MRMHVTAHSPTVRLGKVSDGQPTENDRLPATRPLLAATMAEGDNPLASGLPTSSETDYHSREFGVHLGIAD
jgi:hypothetical protein